MTLQSRDTADNYWGRARRVTINGTTNPTSVLSWHPLEARFLDVNITGGLSIVTVHLPSEARWFDTGLLGAASIFADTAGSRLVFVDYLGRTVQTVFAGFSAHIFLRDNALPWGDWHFVNRAMGPKAVLS